MKNKISICVICNNKLKLNNYYSSLTMKCYSCDKDNRIVFYLWGKSWQKISVIDNNLLKNFNLTIDYNNMVKKIDIFDMRHNYVKTISKKLKKNNDIMNKKDITFIYKIINTK